MIDRAHLMLVAALAACLCAIGGFAYGVGVGEAREQATQRRAETAAKAAGDAAREKIDASTIRAQAAEQGRQGAVREIYHESQKIVERPVYRNVCVDAAGVGLLDRAAATANGESVSAAAGATAAPAIGPAD